MNPKTLAKIDITLLLFNCIMLGVYLAEKDWTAVTLYSILVAFLATNLNESMDALIELGEEVWKLCKKIDEAVEKDEQKKKN